MIDAARQQQISCGNDRQKGKGKDNSGFPAGMTDRKARATPKTRAKTTADFLRE